MGIAVLLLVAIMVTVFCFCAALSICCPKWFTTKSKKGKKRTILLEDDSEHDADGLPRYDKSKGAQNGELHGSEGHCAYKCSNYGTILTREEAPVYIGGYGMPNLSTHGISAPREKGNGSPYTGTGM